MSLNSPTSEWEFISHMVNLSCAAGVLVYHWKEMTFFTPNLNWSYSQFKMFGNSDLCND